MNASDFESCLGKTDDSPEIVKLLSALKVVKKPKPPADGGDADIELTKLGLVLKFRALDRKSSKMTLAVVQFYSDAEEGFTTFSGTLPGGLTFSDNQAAAKKKLGKPAVSKKMFRFDKWHAGKQDIGVDYTKADVVSVVHLSLPQ